MELKGSSILITGASSGIGAEAAVALAAAGARLTLSARRADALEATAARIHAAGGIAQCAPGDIGDPANVRAMVAKAVDEHGGLDILFNNAGFLGPRVPLDAYPVEELKTSLHTNIVGTFQMMQAALEPLKRAPMGAIVNMSSYLGRHGSPDCAGYVAGKFGIEGLTQALASEVEGSSLAVLTLAPGMVATDMLRDYLCGEDVTPFRRPQDVAQGIVRLFLDLRPAHNGMALDIDPWLART
jgi:NAD(P)-dependent dehydrogenase (short-subunit alcohol dehydrogenase family)